MPKRNPGAAWQEHPIRFRATQTRMLGDVPYEHVQHFVVKEDVFVTFLPHQVGWFVVDMEPGFVWTPGRRHGH